MSRYFSVTKNLNDLFSETSKKDLTNSIYESVKGLSRHQSVERSDYAISPILRGHDFKIDSDISVMDKAISYIFETLPIPPAPEELAMEALKPEAEIMMLLGEDFEAPEQKALNLSLESDDFIVLSSPGRPTD